MFEDIKNRQLEINKSYIEKGVEIIDIYNTYIAEDVIIGKGTVIKPGTHIEKGSKIGENCNIGPSSRITNSTIGNETKVEFSVVEESIIGDSTTVGPYAHIRGHSHVGSHCRIGNFLEIKNSNIGDGSKSAHLSYIGDADLGEDVNIGCGVVFVNYNGQTKERSLVKDGAFVGCNSNLVAPVTVEEKAYIAAGSTVTKDVKKESLFIERGDIVHKEDWVKNTGILNKDKKK